jgi:hypothetical protein
MTASRGLKQVTDSSSCFASAGTLPPSTPSSGHELSKSALAGVRPGVAPNGYMDNPDQLRFFSSARKIRRIDRLLCASRNDLLLLQGR